MEKKELIKKTFTTMFVFGFILVMTTIFHEYAVAICTTLFFVVIWDSLKELKVRQEILHSQIVTVLERRKR